MRQTLYRDTKRGRLGGVCAGLAQYLGVEVWVVRLVAATGLIFASFITLVLYLAAWCVLDRQPETAEAAPEPPHIKQHSWQHGLSPSQALAEVDRQLMSLDKRVQAMEACVTSSAFQWKRDLGKR